MGPAVAMDLDVGPAVRLRAGVRRKPHDARAGHRAVELSPHGVGALRDWPGVSAAFHRRVVPAGVDAAVAVSHVLAVVGELASGLVIDPALRLRPGYRLLGSLRGRGVRGGDHVA